MAAACVSVLLIHRAKNLLVVFGRAGERASVRIGPISIDKVFHHFSIFHALPISPKSSIAHI